MEQLLFQLSEFGQIAWQVFWLPVIIWTPFALAAWIILRAVPHLHPIIHYQARLALMISLPVGLSLLYLYPMGQAIPANFEIVVFAYDVNQTITTPVSQSAESFFWNLQSSIGFITLISILGAVIGFIRLGTSWIALSKKSGQSLADLRSATVIQNAISKSGIRKSVHVWIDPSASIPYTYGWRKPVIILPDGINDSEKLQSILMHECIHIRRGDYIVQWIENILAAIFIFHPLMHVFRREIISYREMSCDAELLGVIEASPKSYASLLMEFTAKPVPSMPLVSAMARHKSNIGQRIARFSTYKQTPETMRQVKKYSIITAFALLGTLTLTVACSDIVLHSKEQTEPDAVNLEAEEVFIVVEQMPEPIGGLQAIYNNIRYPDIARRAGIEGRVVIQFVVDRNGNVVDPTVIRGIGGGCDEAALDAIRDIKFTPGVQRGQPVNVQFQLPIVFRLNPADRVRNSDKTNSQIIQSGSADSNLSAELRGIVLDTESGLPLAGAKISIPVLNLETATDGNGQFTFRGLKDGTYGIQVGFVGYKMASGEVTVKDRQITLTQTTMVRE